MKNVVLDQGDSTPSRTEKKPIQEYGFKSLSQTPSTTITGTEMIRGLKIENVVFCLDTGKEKYLFATEDDAIDQLRKLDKKEINPDNSQIVQVTATGTAWKLTQIPWSRIAIKLL